MTRSGRPAPVPARRPVRGGRSLSYAGSAPRIFMIRRRADSRAAELVLTSVAVAAVIVTWTLITELQQHMMAGRLTIAEFEERVGVAHGARTRGDIERARAQLPRPQSPPGQ